MEITILEELKNWIPPLSSEEKNGLESNLLEDGCREPLLLWKNPETQENILVDGHNRYEICKKHNIAYNTVEKKFNDIEEVKLWMLANQLHRRNLTDKNRDYLIGKYYSQQKQQKGKISNLKQFRDDNDIEDLLGEQTAEKIAEDSNLSKSSIMRAEKFQQGVDIVKENLSGEEQDEVVNKILKDQVDISKNVFQDISNIKDKIVQKDVAKVVGDAIKSGDKEYIQQAKDKVANAVKKTSNKGKGNSDIEGSTLDITKKILGDRNSNAKEPQDKIFFEPKTQEEEELMRIRNAIIENINVISNSRHLITLFKLSAIKPPEANKVISETTYKLYLGSSKDFYNSFHAELELNEDSREYFEKQIREKIPFITKYEVEEKENFDFDETIRKRFKF